MRASVLALAFAAACGSSHSATNPDGNGSGNGDGNGGVDTPGSNPGTVTVTLIDHPNNAAMYSFIAAYQDGAGGWQAAPTPTGDTYTLTINSPVWAFAWTCIVPATSATRVELAYFTAAEKPSLIETVPAGCTDRLPATVGVSGTVSGLTDPGGYLATYATRSALVSKSAANGTGGFSLEAPSGSHDLLITHGTLSQSGGAVDSTAIVRGVTAPTTTAAVDWSNSDAVTTADVTVSSQTGVFVATTLYTAGGTTATMVASQTPPFMSIALPASQAMAGDVYDQEIAVRGGGATAVVESFNATIADQTYSAPAALGTATSSVPTSAPYPEILTSWNAYTGAVGYAWDARQGGGGGVSSTNVRWTTILGSAYVGGTPKFQMPDLSGLTGWSAMFELATGQAVTGTVSAVQSSAGASDFPSVTPEPSGTTRTTVSSDWTVTP